MSVAVAAVQLRVTRQRVYQLIEEGKLVGRRSGRTWMVSERSVQGRIALLLSEGGL